VREPSNSAFGIAAGGESLNTDRDSSPSMPAPQSADERELAELIVSALNLEEVAPVDIDPEAPLFKTGLGLDSIDALELALEISKRYGFQLRSDDENNVRIFSSLRSLASHIAQNRVSA
jgi:acyl carrier protein